LYPCDVDPLRVVVPIRANKNAHTHSNTDKFSSIFKGHFFDVGEMRIQRARTKRIEHIEGVYPESQSTSKTMRSTKFDSMRRR
jgi:hypothetical protein